MSSCKKNHVVSSSDLGQAVKVSEVCFGRKNYTGIEELWVFFQFAGPCRESLFSPAALGPSAMKKGVESKYPPGIAGVSCALKQSSQQRNCHNSRHLRQLSNLRGRGIMVTTPFPGKSQTLRKPCAAGV